ncbi:MAG: fatty acid desaturase, partial [Cyanobium sp.]
MTSLPPAGVALLVLVRSILQTGLFIVGHDAMHRSLLPASPDWNDRIGRLALGLYAWLPWDACCRNHRRHHQAPGSSFDPDHHGDQRGAFGWYVRFMASYLNASQMGGLLGCWLFSLALIAPHLPNPPVQLLLFWVLPLLISSLQLFVVGTYLPHRQAATISPDRHHATSLDWPEFLSLLACFHFGYHWEHHQHP